VSASRGALIRVCRTPVVNFLRGGVICSVRSFFRANHTSSWTFQEQTPSRFLEGCQRSMLLVGKIPMLSNIGISKLACKKHSGGVAYDRHGNALISATRLEKQGLLRHNHKRANRSQTGARPKHALDRALTTQQSFLGHPGRPGPGDISAWIVRSIVYKQDILLCHNPVFSKACACDRHCLRKAFPFLSSLSGKISISHLSSCRRT
jgi:hypothetical protein